MNQRAWIQAVERMDAREFAALLASKLEPEQEQALKTHLGPDAYERMRDLAGQASRAAPKGNVVVLHGIMGGELTYYGTDAEPDQIWLKIFRIIAGRFDTLPLNPDGTTVKHITPTGILKQFYGEQLLSLMKEGWNVHAYWYDWRLDINISSDVLAHRIVEWFGSAPVHLIAHSMGGLVARAFIRQHGALWASMWDQAGNGAAGGRLVMLGTPNRGSFAIPQLLFGLNDVIRKLALADLRHSLQDLLEIAATFVGTYQMLPSPLIMPDVEPLYHAETYPHLRIGNDRFTSARQSHNDLAMVVDPSRMVYVAGFDQPTYAGVRDWSKLSSFDGYTVSRLGDGTVPHRLGLLENVPAYYVKAEHGALPCDAAVMQAMDELLRSGHSSSLASEVPADLRGDDEEARKELALRRDEESAALELAAPLKTALRSGGCEVPAFLTDSERELESLILRDFVGRGGSAATPALVRPASAGIPTSIGLGVSAGSVTIRFANDPIQDIGSKPADLPIDAIAVGHYTGVRPVNAEYALDRAISGPVSKELLLTSFTERGTIRGEVGQPFFLEDARSRGGDGPGRIIAVAGMGQPGRFGMPELTVLARELVWTLAQIGKRHLATVLIGSGDGNLSVRDAVCGWLEGIRRALAQSGERRLEVITIVEMNPAKLVAIQRAFAAEAQRPGLGLQVNLEPLPEEGLQETARRQAEEKAKAFVAGDAVTWKDQAVSSDASRFTVELEGSVYRYGAVTESASVPERRIMLDPELVSEANDALAGEGDAIAQMKLGQYLMKLLIPADLRKELSSAHPLVITCDATAARIHWEMVAQPDLTGSGGVTDGTFLGIHRGLTRQLRTRFAPSPEPPPPPSRILRVLIVANPSETDPLPGAEAEGKLVRTLFERLRRQELDRPAGQRRVAEVEIVALIGPKDGTRARVMQELLLGSYDILHFAGHCEYVEGKPSSSGWIFTDRKHLSANELSRIDQIPKFVFSNACESGITPDRSGERSASMVPTFAEAFFARGVRDFIATGWPVNDRAALDFAESFYSAVLGLGNREPAPIHVAMREARMRIFAESCGRKTWGAYQHYGSPYTCLIAANQK